MDNIGDTDISNELRADMIRKKQQEIASKAMNKPKPKPKVKKRHSRSPKKKKAREDHKAFKTPAWFRRYAPVIFIILSIILSVGVRLHYAGLPLMDDWARMSADATFRPQITQDVNQMYPYYSDDQKTKLIDQQVKEKIDQYQAQIAQKAESLRDSFRDPQGQIYLYGIDPYSYYKNAKDGKLEDFLSFFEYYFHNFISLFNKTVSMMTTSFYIPLIFVALTMFPIYFIARRIAGDLAGLIASATFAIHPEFLKYSLAGMSDTNTINIFFMLAISWVFLELILQKKLRNRIIAGASLVLLLLLFRFTWTGYYIVIGLLAAISAVYLGLWLFNKLTADKTTNGRIAYLVLVCLIIVIAVLLGLKFLIGFMPAKIQLYLGSGSLQGVWPDSYSSISELQPLPFSDMVPRLGGPVFLAIVLLAAAYTFWRAADSEDIPFGPLLALTAAAIMIPAAFKAIRIFPFSIPYICILFGFGLFLIIDSIPRFIHWIDQKDTIIRSLAYVLVIALLLFIIGSQFMADYSSVRSIKPRMDDSLYNTAVKIGEVSPPDAKIFTWWDKGHFFYALSDRDVLLKAAPSMPRTYWMAKALMTPDENLSAGIIRMLSCNGEKKALSLVKGNLSMNGKIGVLDSILKLNKTEADEYLAQNNQDRRITRYTHCDAPVTYIALTDDMFTRFHTVQEYAYWDFDLPSDEQKTYKAFTAYDCSRDNDTFTCSVGSTQVTANSRTGHNNVDLAGLWFFIDGNLTRFSYDSKSEYTMVIYPRSDKYNAIVVDKNIADSTYIRLMVLDGYGLDDFRLIADNSRPETLRTVAYLVKWR
jgi:dolichyl-diphosphooligosaccharide--protein glycosyltransferase